jgi:uncharacterized protein YdeI (YjbR/CyaY-like superfamily)
MKHSEPRVDAYIAASADFAKPILEHFRGVVHAVCPDVEESIKWGFPHFGYKNQMMCSMAAFKNHCAVTFWKASVMRKAEDLVRNAKSEVSMGHLGKIAALKDLPKDSILKAYIKEAMRLNDEGIALPAKKKVLAKTEMPVPDYVQLALQKNKKAQQHFMAFSPSHRREYLSWITEAKTEATRQKRLATAIEWLSEGKDRNWKYK